MKITVVTISYNQSKFLRECIDSVLEQNYDNLEYIIVDPGSTDGSRDIIDSYGDRIIRIYEKDSGPADGLNKGFLKATGDLFCYLNSDDMLLPNTFKKIFTYFDANPCTDIVIGHARIIDAKTLVRRNVFSDKFDLVAAAYGSSLVIQPSTFFRKEIFNRVGGFNPENKSNWDGELFTDMAISGAKIHLINDFFSCYRVHNGSITGTARLAELHALHSGRMFKKIMKRNFSNRDFWWQKYYRVKKHLLNPKATFERMLKGSVFGAEK